MRNSQCQDAFYKVKERLVSSPVLACPKNDLTYILETDASLFRVGGILSQADKTITEHIIAYGSKTLSKTERNYCTTMQELLSAAVCMRQFHYYLWVDILF